MAKYNLFILYLFIVELSMPTQQFFEFEAARHMHRVEPIPGTWTEAYACKGSAYSTNTPPPQPGLDLSKS